MTVPSTAPSTPSSAPSPGATDSHIVRFAPNGPFQLELRRRVESYFSTSGRSARDVPAMYRKTAVLLAWLAASYIGLVFGASSWVTAVPLAISLGLAMAGVGFGIQHDGGHLAYSRFPLVNRLMAMSLDLVGASSYVWRSKHTFLHHTYTNIHGFDEDIDIGMWGRMAPHQTRRRLHRFQHLYLWPMYGVLSLKWQLYDDFRDVLTGRIGSQRFPRPKGLELLALIAAKLLFITLLFALPMTRHAPLTVIGYVGLTSLVCGLTIALVFQLAHCVEEAGFFAPDPGSHRIPSEWATHQVATTVDFARDSAFFTWYLGGLNFQVEHHLFPHVCHIHYPALAPIVEQVCREHGVPYRAHPSFAAAVRSHYRFLRGMGRQDTPALAA